ncbi:hypothetical protein BDW67DRAFT_150889 [Aspergillus spinulosporus]
MFFQVLLGVVPNSDASLLDPNICIVLVNHQQSYRTGQICFLFALASSRSAPSNICKLCLRSKVLDQGSSSR